MSQDTMVIAGGQSGLAVRTAMNSNLQALASTSKGPSAPSTAYAGQQWVDDNTPSGTVWTHNIYSGASWYALGTVSTDAGVYVPNGLINLGSASAPSHTPVGDTDTGVWSPGANTWAVSTSGVERFRLTTNGLVGFGTTPTYLMHVSNLRDDAVPARMTIQNTNAAGGVAEVLLRDDRGTSDNKRVGIRNVAGTLTIGRFNDAESTYTEWVRAEPTGFRVNASVPVVRSDEKVSVGGMLGVYPAGTTSTPAIVTRSPDDTFHLSFYNAAGAEVGNVTGGGGASVSYNTSSDERLKRDIVDVTAEQAEAALRALRPILGRYTSEPADAPLRPMYLAHEYQSVVPHAVTGVRGAAAMMAAQYDPLSPFFASALVSALDKIAALESRVATLEG